MINLFLDSGAYSASVKDIEIDIDKYIDYIKEHKKYIHIYANLDVINSAEETLENQKTMEKAGLSPLPCFHINENFSYLEYYVDNYDYIALGGLVGSKQPDSWLSRCFDVICDNKGYPKCKVHGFGVTSVSLMFKFPWYSVDSMIKIHGGFVFLPVLQQKRKRKVTSTIILHWPEKSFLMIFIQKDSNLENLNSRKSKIPKTINSLIMNAGGEKPKPVGKGH